MTDWSALLDHHQHRPYPLPDRAWHMTMSWLDLLFAHWSFAPDTIRALLPANLELDTREGRAWVGVVPFRMANVGPRGINWVPGVSAFPELNVRTYVVHEGKPGVWFFSLDAASMLAVRAARIGFHLPYYHADMRCEEREGWIDYHSDRAGEQPGRFVGRYRPIGEVYRSEPGTLEHWLTERYCLYALDRKGRIRRGEIHHEPWPLQAAQLELETCTVSEAWGIHPVGEPETLHFVRSLDVVGWLLE
ncbi:YqjF family protein [Nannocystaceae bacterium ST9]